MTDYTELVKALRIRSGNLCPGDICDRCEAIHFLCSDKVMHDAAAAIEALIADVEKKESRITGLGNRIFALEQQFPKRGEIVRCGECKYWSEVDTSDGLRYGQCDRPGSAIRGNCFIRESWFCADGERSET